MSSRGRSPSPRSITSSARGKKTTDSKMETDGDGDRSVSRGRNGKARSPSQSRSRSGARARSRSKSNASMRSRSRSRSRSIPPPRVPKDSRDTHAAGRGAGMKVVIVSGLTKNVRREHLEEIFGKYGRVTGLDLPTFAICKSLPDSLGYKLTLLYSRPEQRQSSHRIRQFIRRRKGPRSHGSRTTGRINIDGGALRPTAAPSGTNARKGKAERTR